MPRKATRLPGTERDLSRAVLCERAGYLAPDGSIATDCPGDCIAHLAGYQGMHVGALRTTRGWRTPTRGSLGKGWPDLVLVGRGRLVFAELKQDGGADPFQVAVLSLLATVHGAESYVWTWDQLDDGTIWRLLTDRQGGR